MNRPHLRFFAEELVPADDARDAMEENDGFARYTAVALEVARFRCTLDRTMMLLGNIDAALSRFNALR